MTHTPIILFAIGLAVLALPGCGSGENRNAATAEAATSVRVDVGKSKQQLDAFVSSLKGVRDASDSADVGKLRADMSTTADKLRSSLADTGAASDSAVATGRDQITRWHKDADAFTDAGLRESSGKREAELRRSVDELATSNAGLKTTSTAYLERVTQALSALDLDPSRKGVDSIKTVVTKLVDDEPALRSALTEVAARSDAVRAVISP